MIHLNLLLALTYLKKFLILNLLEDVLLNKEANVKLIYFFVKRDSSTYISFRKVFPLPSYDIGEICLDKFLFIYLFFQKLQRTDICIFG